jgi:hypothetical protein
MMKKMLIAFGLSLVLAGCSLPNFAKETKTNTNIMPKPAVSVESSIDSGNFYFNAGEAGLVLLNTDDDDFSVELSTQEIGEANIVDGILTFTELLPEGENVRVVNLAAYAEALKKKK